jgi:hypothetical protein
MQTPGRRCPTVIGVANSRRIYYIRGEIWKSDLREYSKQSYEALTINRDTPSNMIFENRVARLGPPVSLTFNGKKKNFFYGVFNIVLSSHKSRFDLVINR